jgi:hypothetical protein
MSRLKEDSPESLNKDNSASDYATVGYAEPTSILDRIKAEKSRLTFEHNRRMRDLTRVERMLENSEAESIIKEATDTLYKLGNKA